MSHIASAWAIKQTGLSMAAKIVLMILADYHNSVDGGCYPSLATLAEMACCDERTVTRAVNELTVMGLVTREARTSANGRQTSNQYNLNLQISERGDSLSPPTPPNLSPLEPVNNKPSDITYRADLILKNDNQEGKLPRTVSAEEKLPRTVLDVDEKKVFWDEAVGMLKSMGLVEKTAKSITGRFLKLSGNDQDKVIHAITEAADQGVTDPIAYVTAILKGRKGQKRKDVDDAFAELRAASDARKAEWRRQGLLDDTGDGGGDDPVRVQPEPDQKPKPVRQTTRRGYGTVSARRVAEIVRPDFGNPVDAPVYSNGSGVAGESGISF